jgi:hypothetical protein
MSALRTHLRPAGERGVALLTTILMMVLMSALLVGFTTAVMSDQSYRAIDRDRARAFYGAQSGIEKQNADLARLFINQVGPTDSQVTALGLPANRPTIPNVTFVDVGASPAYAVTPVGPATSGIISSGPYEGLMALKREFQLDATARAVDGGEVHLRRRVETVAIPVFQFGIFSSVDVSFSAADNFDFGGRVHTNANLFLAQASGTTLTLREKVTAVGEIVRQRLSNRESIDASGSTGTVNMTRGNSSGPFRNLTRTEGSVTDGVYPAPTLNNSWPTISLSTYVGNIRNGRTGVRPLNLDLVTANGANVDLIKRPPATETSSSAIFAERYFKKVSVRILLSDQPNDITALPTVSSGAPIRLDGDWFTTPPAGYGPIIAARPPVARSAGPYPDVPVNSTNSTVNSGGAVSTTHSSTITMNPTLPDYFKVPTGMQILDPVTMLPIVTGVTCTGNKTVNTITVCSRAALPGNANAPIPANAILSGTSRTVDARPVTMTLQNTAWTWTHGVTNQTLTAALPGTAFPTFNMSVNTFFIGGSNPRGNVLVTCTGYDTTPRFTGCNVPVALSAGDKIETAYLSSAGTATLGGYIKVEIQRSPDVWQDVTMEVLRFGISGPNLAGRPCGDPTPNAIIRLQRLRDNNEPSTMASCSYAGSTASADHWPLTFFDAREGVVRDAGTAGPTGHNNRVTIQGTMHYIELDARNLSSWFAGTGVYAGSSGPLAMREGNSPTAGFSVYFSDRRGNRNSSNQETGEFGFEDVVNPSSSTGAANGILDEGEDMNANGVLDTYGQFVSFDGNWGNVPPGATTPLDSNARPWTFITGGQAKVNRPLHFRRVLKVTNGSLGNLVAPGLTISAENPVYVQGNWNANTAAGFGDPHVATSVVADAVTLLSSNWNDLNSYGTTGNLSPYFISNRPRANDTYYRLAIISGKGPIFPRPSGAGATYGTDGGVHSFLRFIEGDAAVNDRIWYRGSMVTFYYHRQGLNPFKCCNSMVYGVPVRQYAFDVDFLDPTKLPPLTPVFRDLNALGFTQETRPGR